MTLGAVANEREGVVLEVILDKGESVDSQMSEADLR